MVQFFKDRANTVFVVDYAESLKALRTHQAILNYAANLKLNVVELINCDVTVDLLHAFAVMRDQCRIDPLTKILANVLYFCKYGEVLYIDSFESFNFTKIVEYVTTHRESLLIQLAFLNSLPLYVAISHDQTDQLPVEGDWIKSRDTQVHPEISMNLFNLFTHEHFLIMFLERSVPLEDQIYFEAHFERHMYQGKSLFGLFGVAENTYFLMCKHVTDSIKDGLERVKLIDLYGSLLEGTRNYAQLDELQQTIEETGGILNFVQATRKDRAEFNRVARKVKKQQKQQKQQKRLSS